MNQSRRTRKRDATHRALMHSAKLLFEKHGLGNVTVEEIAETADVSRSTFFSHFDSVDDLLTEIANEEIDDILSASNKDGRTDVNLLFEKLNQDTYPYPYLMSELMVKSILSPKGSSLSAAFEELCKEIEREGYEKALTLFSSKDISALIFGAYFGLVFQKFIDNEKFEDPDELNDKIQSFINLLKNQEEKNYE